MSYDGACAQTDGRYDEPVLTTLRIVLVLWPSEAELRKVGSREVALHTIGLENCERNHPTTDKPWLEFVIMEIKRIGSQPSSQGPSDYFTGTVRIDPLFQAPAPARGVGASVTFRAWGSDRVAHPSIGANVDHHFRSRLRSTRGQSHRGHSRRRCCLVCSGRKALARR